MSDVIKSAVPPKRFPEFEAESGWHLTTIGDIGNFYYGKSAPKWSLEENAPTPCVRYGELYTKFGAVITETYSRTNIDIGNLRFSKGGEILVPRVGEKPEDFGRCCSYLTLKNIAIGEMISVFETEQNPLFYTYYFRNMYKEFAKVVEGQNVKNLYYNQLEPLPIYRPASLKEQQKIADCLSSLDDLITAQNQKIEALKQHKKGLMQQLFPAEGETVPKLRFPEFENDGEWQPRELSEIVTPVVREVSKPEANYLALGIRSHGKGTFHKPDQAPEKNAMDKLYLVNKGDLIVNITFAWEGAIAIVKKEDHGTYVSHRFPTYAFNEKLSSSSFFQYVIINKSFIYKLGLISPGGAGRNRVMNKRDFLKITVLLPSRDEQERVGKCLSSLDDAISTQIQKLEALKAHKKGLMQQLFPSLEELA